MQLFHKAISAIWLLFLTFGFLANDSLQAQSFFGYQTIGRSTVFFSVGWQGKPLLGVGYNHRSFGTTFSDWQAELRFPLNAMYRFDEYQVIAGMYKPLALKRTFVGTGAHVRILKQTEGSRKETQVLLALTVLPTYVYTASTNDGGYGTVAPRITYAPVIFAQVKAGNEAAQTQALAAHRVELGGHLDLHLERTLGLGFNGYVQRSFTPANSILNHDTKWKGEGDFYMGSTYRLGRL